MNLIIIPSAYRHGFTDKDILHAYGNPVRVHPNADDDMDILVGPSHTGMKLIEIGVVPSDEGPVIVHAMNARDKYL